MAAINTRIVHRSNALPGNADGANFRYDEAMLTGKGFKRRITAMSVVAGLAGFLAAAVLPPTRSLMENPWLPKPGDGPTPAQQLAGRYDLRFFGRTDNGGVLRAKVTGDRDPGYGSTAKMLSRAVTSIALNHYQSGKKTGRAGGFWTPSTMFDQRFVDRLVQQAGLTFEVV